MVGPGMGRQGQGTESKGAGLPGVIRSRWTCAGCPTTHVKQMSAASITHVTKVATSWPYAHHELHRHSPSARPHSPRTHVRKLRTIWAGAGGWLHTPHLCCSGTCGDPSPAGCGRPGLETGRRGQETGRWTAQPAAGAAWSSKRARSDVDVACATHRTQKGRNAGARKYMPTIGGASSAYRERVRRMRESEESLQGQ